MPRFLVHHRHEAGECGAAFAAFQGHESPLRHRDALCTCLTGGHEVWWDVEARSERDALELLPHFVACRSAAHPVRRIQTP
jgi:hypothetical protein